MNKFENLMEAANDLLNRKQEEEKKCNVLLWILAIIGVIAAVAGIAYAVYRYFTPDYLEDFEDDFEDEDFEDDDEEDDFFADAE